MGKRIPPVILEEEPSSALDQEIVRIVEKVLNERMIELASDDIKLIAKEMLPDLDRIISTKVKNHFYEIGLFLVEKFEE